MKKQKLIVSSQDLARLQPLINSARLDSRVRIEDLNSLEAELSRATVVDAEALPADVVAMNSTVWFVELESGEEESYTIVYPRDADVLQDRISVFAPIGTALLGYRTGDIVEWRVPAGTRRLKITMVQHDSAHAGVAAQC